MVNFYISKKDNIIRETIDLTIQAENEAKRVKSLNTAQKLFYIAKALKTYAYYEWWAYYFNEKDYNTYAYAREVDSIRRRINRKELIPNL